MKRLKGSIVCRATHTFALSVGITAICMLATLKVLGLESGQAKASSAKEMPAAAAASLSAQELEDRVIPLGKAFGIKLYTDGVIVASLSDIYTDTGTCCPAREAGLRPGDYLLEANGVQLPSNGVLAKVIGRSQGESITFRVRRGDEDFDAVVKPVYGEGAFKTGMWVRDSAAGVGTLTFYDPASGGFAGLGHGICDADAGSVMALRVGEPAEITLCGIVKGLPDEPGQLRGYFSSEEPIGQLLDNNETGVYGTLNEAPQGELVEVLERDEVSPGPVQLLVSIDETGPKLYEGEIVQVQNADQPTRNLVVKVTDSRLLEATGGIVQGMSGAPILQDGKLAGAVTHVFTDDPTMGYGIFARTMVEQERAAAQARDAA
ncbi:MAG: SpoIVB peptidase [Acutalibacter sp.]|jgi:stage IV sporulation protein B|nr:SpoIVB peptidase [Acutalibacter sp.]